MGPQIEGPLTAAQRSLQVFYSTDDEVEVEVGEKGGGRTSRLAGIKEMGFKMFSKGLVETRQSSSCSSNFFPAPFICPN